MYSKNITYRLIIIFAAILAVGKCSQPEKNEYSVWVYSIDSLANKIYQCESSISKFQYYYPYHIENSQL